MSVPKDKRTEGQLTINTEARRICTHVLRILGNEKNFPKEQEWFTDKMREVAINIDLKCWKANNNVKRERKKAGQTCKEKPARGIATFLCRQLLSGMANPCE